MRISMQQVIMTALHIHFCLHITTHTKQGKFLDYKPPSVRRISHNMSVYPFPPQLTQSFVQHTDVRACVGEVMQGNQRKKDSMVKHILRLSEQDVHEPTWKVQASAFPNDLRLPKDHETVLVAHKYLQGQFGQCAMTEV